MRDELVALLKTSGFHLSKWSSNDPALLHTITKSNSENPSVNLDKTGNSKTLGLTWNCVNDYLKFKFKIVPVQKRTKRFYSVANSKNI